jgi:hypothetical protein
MAMQKVKHLHLELEKKNPNIHHDYMITEKVDGWYVEAVYSIGGGWRGITSSSGRYIPSMEHIAIEKLSTILPPSPHCKLIMEAYIPHTKFHILNGVFNRSVGNYRCDDVHFIVHDYVDLYTDLTMTALNRFNLIEKLQLPTRFDRATLLGVSNSIDVWKRYFDGIVEKGGEGIVLKQANGLYCAGKRNSTLMKIKEEITVDLLCTRVYETIGTKGNPNLNIELVNSIGTITTVRIAKQEDIDKIQEDHTEILGRVCEVKAMKILEDGKLREPRFVCIRYDKLSTEID